ncbi:MAG: putative Ig domain-containing protein, partial [Mycobacterium sp.]
MTSFTDTGLAPLTTYYYQVLGTNANGDSTPSVVASGTTFPTYSVNGLVAYWNLDEISGGTSTDITGNAHTGTWEGEQAADVGYFNGGHWFHGTGAIASRISVVNKTDIQFAANQSFTLAAWVKPSALRGSPEAVIAKSRDTGNYYGIWINAANQWTAKGPGGDVVGPAVTQDVWTHVAVVQDGPANTRKLYINGALAATGTAQAADGSGALWLSQANSGGGAVIEAFPGFIDEVRIYNRALPATELTDLLGAPVLQAASSQVQGTAGTFGLVLSPVTTQVIESRQGATAGNYSIVANFSAPVFNVAAALSLQSGGGATGAVGTITYSNGNKTATIPLTGVANAQKLKIHLSGIKRNGSASDVPGTADVLFNVLRADVNKDNVVSSLDATIVSNNQAAAVVSSTFQFDINCDGAVNATDSSLVNTYLGTSIGTQTDSNIALYCQATASTTNGANVAGNAFDGKGTNQTRWESASADPQWIYVNLGSISTIHQINVNWEAAAGKTYTFETSNNGTTWSSPIATETNNTGAGIKSYPVNASGQYVRLSGTTRTTTFGYSPWEIEVIGIPGVSTVPSITSALTKTGTVGTALTYNITATNSPTSYNATPLPAGLAINTTTGAITGTPTAAGTTNTTISATNASGTGTATLVFTISAAGAAPVINSALTKSGTVGTALTYNITATNTPTSYNATPLPAGLAINTTTGAITGTPTAAGTTNTTISATNANGTGSATLVFTISASGAPVINSALTKAGTTGTALTYQITATNTPTSYNATPLPAGLAINTTTGAITGTPTATGTTNTTISATNASGTGTATLVFTISAPGSAPVINSSLNQGGTVGQLFTYQITATNAPTSYGAAGLPSGLFLNTTTGVISGYPNLAATSNITISATNASGTGSATLVLTIAAGTDTSLALGQQTTTSS